MVSNLCVLKGGGDTDCNMLQARKTESSLQKLRQSARAQKRGGAASGVSDHNVSETDKMCMQLFLDIQVNLLICVK